MKFEDVIFILGAGASVPYGYPTANQLRQKIVRGNVDVISYTYRNLENQNKIDYNWWENRWKPLIDQFDKSNTESIDLFLTRNRNKIDTDLGVLLILYFLSWYESRYKIIRFDKDWYFAFFNELTREVTQKEQLYLLVKSPIQIITFNYDRSLEYFLYTSLVNSFTLDSDEARTIYNMLFSVYHVYGKIADLDWQDAKGISYGDNDLFKNGDLLSKNVNLIYDDRNHIPDNIKTLIYNANQIFVLGFGFAKANIDKLDLKNLLQEKHKLFATGLNLFDSQIIQIKQSLMRGLVGIKEHNIQIEQKMDCLQLLQASLF